MFGPRIILKEGRLNLLLRPVSRDDLPEIARWFQSLDTTMWVRFHVGAMVIEDELEWYEKNRKNPDGIVWIVALLETEEPIGVATLHGVTDLTGGCTVGMVIGQKKWRGQGVGTMVHKALIWYAFEYCNRSKIWATIRDPNEASKKAAFRVGYRQTGVTYCNIFRHGRWWNTINIVLFNLKEVARQFPDGVPEVLADGAAVAAEILRIQQATPFATFAES